MIELVSYFVSSDIIHPFFELGTLEFAWKLEVHIESPKMLWKFFYIFFIHSAVGKVEFGVGHCLLSLFIHL